MNAKKHFQKHYAKLKREAILRSAVWGFIIGLFCGFVSLLALWFTKLDGILISLIVLAAVSLIASALFYLLRFKPTVQSSARRIDGLGLEERLVTMVELEGDESLIAKLQRDDAKRALEEFSPSKIRFNLPKKAMVLLSVIGALTFAMLTLSILSAAGLIPSGSDMIESTIEKGREVYISVTYEAEDGGYINGESDQLILSGTRPEAVRAEAEDGYVFVEWDDGNTNPNRADGNLVTDVIFVAIFEPIDEEGDDDGDGEEKADDEPSEDAQESNNGTPDESDQNSASAGGKYEEKNQIKKNDTFYREVMDVYKELLKKRLEEDGDTLTPEEKAIIEAYLSIV